MCLPVLAIGAIASALGMGMSYLGQQKADHALSSTFNREQARQKGMEKEQIEKFQDSLNSTSGVADPAAQAAAAARRDAILMGATKSAAPDKGGYLPGTTGATNQVVNTHAVQAGKAADAHTSGLAAALAAMGGMTDQLQDNSITLGRNSGDIDQIGGFKRGSLDVLQSEMDAAKQKGGTLRTLGGLAQSIGGMMMSGGLGGAPVGGGPINLGGGTASFFAKNPFGGFAI